MDYALVVVIPFGLYAKGDNITDPDKVAAALETNAANVVRVPKPADVAPEPEPKADKAKN